MQVVLGDGLTHLDLSPDTPKPPVQYQFIVVDVDSKDTSVGLSCPPEAFISPAYLSKLRPCLSPGGAVLFNVAARSQVRLGGVVGEWADAWGRWLRPVPQLLKH